MTTKKKPPRRKTTLTERIKAAEQALKWLQEYIASLDNAVAQHIKESR